MDTEVKITIKNSLRMPKNESLTILKLPGYTNCPFDNSEQGTINCPMGFDTGRWSPNKPPVWMAERLSEEVLIRCQQCRGDFKLSPQQAQAWSNVYEILAEGEK